jgi:hypothetical protein
MYLALLLLLPLILCFLAKYVFWKDSFGWAPFLIAIGACAFTVLGGLAIEFYGVTSDTEVWSGTVTGRQRNEVSCSHSYPCNCHEVCTEDSNGHESCTEHCDTCYEHPFDVDWDVYFSTGKVISIAREDRQGLIEPKRWDAVYTGEPTAETHSFTNYLLAAPGNVMLRHDAPKGFEALIPAYPDNIYDYYRVNRFLVMGGVPVTGRYDWEWILNRLNAELGTVKQVNVIIVIVPTADPRYEYAIQKAWVGGKKNDLVVCIGVTRYPKIDWCRIVSWTTDESIKVLLRDDIQGIGNLDHRDDIMGAVRREAIAHFHRRHMKDLKYLAAAHQPSGTVLLVILMLEVANVAASVYVSYRMQGGGYHRYGGYY